MYKQIRVFVMAATLAASSIVGSAANAQDMLELTVSQGETDLSPTSFDLAALDAMPQIEFTTSTIWTDGDQVFSGVSLKGLLEALNLDGASVQMTALNDYAVTIDISDLTDAAPIVATRMNGDIMSVREKGPFWIVFPYDSDPKFQTERVFSQSIWQLNRLRVLD